MNCSKLCINTKLNNMFQNITECIQNYAEVISPAADSPSRRRHIEFHNKGLEKLFNISNFTAMTYEEQMHYLVQFHAELDRRSELETAIDKGLRQGLEQGLELGREEANIETARKLKLANIDIEIISQCTGLSVEKVQAL